MQGHITLLTHRFSVNARALLIGAFALAGCASDAGLEPGAPGAPGEPGNDIEAQMQELLAQHPEATREDERTVSWDDGKVKLVLPDPSEEASAEAENTADEAAPVAVTSQALYATNWHNCPSGWYCVYQDDKFRGRRLQFSDCTRNDLSNYDFRDKTTSWVNHGSHTVQVKNDLTARPDQVLWTMQPNSMNSNVGSAANDKADFFQCQ